MLINVACLLRAAEPNEDGARRALASLKVREYKDRVMCVSRRTASCEYSGLTNRIIVQVHCKITWIMSAMARKIRPRVCSFLSIFSS